MRRLERTAPSALWRMHLVQLVGITFSSDTRSRDVSRSLYQTL